MIPTRVVTTGYRVCTRIGFVTDSKKAVPELNYRFYEYNREPRFWVSKKPVFFIEKQGGVEKPLKTGFFSPQGPKRGENPQKRGKKGKKCQS